MDSAIAKHESVEPAIKKKRPKYLDLLRIKQPLPAVISILHRISGAALFFPGIPLVLWGMDTALNSPEGYMQLRSLLDNPSVKVALILSLWFFMHHLCAGIRYLAMDLHYAVKLEQARLTSKVALTAGFLLTLGVGALLI